MKNLPLLFGTLLGTIALVVGLAVIFSQPEKPKFVDASIIVKEGRPSKGPNTAKVTIVEFSDFQCPSCRAAQPLLQQLNSKHPNDIRLIYRYFPLTTIHRNAQTAAEIAETAKSFGKFWEMHDLLFEKQDEWSELDTSALNQKLEGYLQKLTIDKTEFLKRMEGKEIKDVVAQDISDGDRAGVNGTPTFFVNGQLTSAPQLVSTVESALSTN